MPATYEPIATTTLSSAASSITFSSIPSTYTDLRGVLNSTGFATADRPLIRFNGSSSGYSGTNLYGDGATAGSVAYTSGTGINIRDNITASKNFMLTIDIFSYAGSTYKTTLTNKSADENGAGSVANAVHLWQTTSAINEVSIRSTLGNNYNAGTTATLYGIKAA